MRATFLALALLAAGAAGAQAPAAAPANAAAHEARMMADLTTLLDLTPAQQPQVQAILQAQHAQMEQEHAQMKQSFEAAKAAGTKPDFSQMKAQHEQLEQQTVQKLTPVLNSSQLAKFQVLQKMMMHHGHMHHRGPPPADAPAN
jgi:hypothetical protein